jgi:hypothetical protein
MALLLHWRSRGFLRPRYGLVDDEELLRVGSTALVCGDGQRLAVTRQELLLLEPVESQLRRRNMAGYSNRRH